MYYTTQWWVMLLLTLVTSSGDVLSVSFFSVCKITQKDVDVFSPSWGSRYTVDKICVKFKFWKRYVSRYRYHGYGDDP